MRDATADTITGSVVATARGAEDARTIELFTHLVRCLHDFVREVRLTPEEWLRGIGFLTATGQCCDGARQEFILLSDTLGVTMLVDALANRRSAGATESTVLGPFFTTDAPDVETGGSIASPGRGQTLFVSGRVTGSEGEPLAGAVLEIWEADGEGRYDVQRADREAPDCRGRVRTDGAGRYAFTAVMPASYPVPTDGPVGAMLRALGRHAYRPAHVHFSLRANGYVPLTTAIYAAGDPHLDSDAVFGVKESLVERFRRCDDEALARARGATNPFFVLERDFVLEKQRA